jgi:hypothetical protein
MRDSGEPATEAALAATLTADSKAGRAVDGMYWEISWSAAEVNWAASVAWRFPCSAARAVMLSRTTQKSEESIFDWW